MSTSDRDTVDKFLDMTQGSNPEVELARAFVDLMKGISFVFAAQIIGIAVSASGVSVDTASLGVLAIAVALHLMALVIAHGYLIDQLSRDTPRKIRRPLTGSLRLTRHWAFGLSEGLAIFALLGETWVLIRLL